MTKISRTALINESKRVLRQILDIEKDPVLALRRLQHIVQSLEQQGKGDTDTFILIKNVLNFVILYNPHTFAATLYLTAWQSFTKQPLTTTELTGFNHLDEPIANNPNIDKQKEKRPDDCECSTIREKKSDRTDLCTLRSVYDPVLLENVTIVRIATLRLTETEPVRTTASMSKANILERPLMAGTIIRNIDSDQLTTHPITDDIGKCDIGDSEGPKRSINSPVYANTERDEASDSRVKGILSKGGEHLAADDDTQQPSGKSPLDRNEHMQVSDRPNPSFPEISSISAGKDCIAQYITNTGSNEQSQRLLDHDTSTDKAVVLQQIFEQTGYVEADRNHSCVIKNDQPCELLETTSSIRTSSHKRKWQRFVSDELPNSLGVCTKRLSETVYSKGFEHGNSVQQNLLKGQVAEINKLQQDLTITNTSAYKMQDVIQHFASEIALTKKSILDISSSVTSRLAINKTILSEKQNIDHETAKARNTSAELLVAQQCKVDEISRVLEQLETSLQQLPADIKEWKTDVPLLKRESELANRYTSVCGSLSTAKCCKTDRSKIMMLYRKLDLELKNKLETEDACTSRP